MTLRKDSIPTKEHTLAICMRMFLEQGYRNTTVRQILREAGISNSSFQNFFRNKEGVLMELLRVVLSGQSEAADRGEDAKLPPIFAYSLQSAMQLAMTEYSETLREIFNEAYIQPETAEYIYDNNAKETCAIFGNRFPDYDKQDFYELGVGSCGLMRNYMAKPCTIHFRLHHKVELFLTSALRIYRVKEDEIQQVIEFIDKIDLEVAAKQMLQKLFVMLELRFDYKFTDIGTSVETTK